MMYILKKYLRKPLIITLTLGASLLLGLLSFAGMYVLMPLLGVSIAAFVLSVIYEGEIYQRNIENALEKLLDGHYTAALIGEEYLKSLDPTDKSLAHFFNTYFKLDKLEKVKNAHPSASRQKRIQLMRIWLGQIIINNQAKTAYGEAVRSELKNISEWQEKAENINRYHRLIQFFSAAAASLMSFGTVYLILEVLPALPFLTIAPAVLPFVVLPMATIAGIAYGFLSYNAVTDFLLQNNLQQWWQDIKSQLKTPNGVSFAIFSALIIALNLTLTLFTAGTWWTVVNASEASWRWLKHPLSRFASLLIAPIVSLSALAFNLENTIETISEFQEESTPIVTQTEMEASSSPEAKSQETFMQLLNPFRILHKLTFTPLLMLLFLGHLISIGLTADRMPGVPAIVSALAGMISEGFEDLHYFFDISTLLMRIKNLGKIFFSPFSALGYLIFQAYKEKPENILPTLKAIFTGSESTSIFSDRQTAHHHHHHHEHSAIPTRVLELLFSPIFALSALWHWHFQAKTEEQKSFKDCYRLQTGKLNECADEPTANLEESNEADLAWIEEETYHILEQHLSYLEQQTTARDLVELKKVGIKEIQQNLKDATSIRSKHETVFAKHRLFTSAAPTTTKAVLDDLETNFDFIKPQKTKKKQEEEQVELTQDDEIKNRHKKPSVRNRLLCFNPNCTTHQTTNIAESFCGVIKDPAKK